MDDLSRKPTGADVWQWHQLCQQLDPMKANEMLLRRFIVKGFFPNCTEGTETHPLDGGWSLKAVGKLTRTVDEAVLQGQAEDLQKAGIPLGTLFTYSPKLVLREYKKLSQEQKDRLADVITEKPSAPTLSLIAPKEPT